MTLLLSTFWISLRRKIIRLKILERARYLLKQNYNQKDFPLNNWYLFLYNCNLNESLIIEGERTCSFFFYGIISVYNILSFRKIRTLSDSHILRELLRISGSNSIKLNAITHPVYNYCTDEHDFLYTLNRIRQ